MIGSSIVVIFMYGITPYNKINKFEFGEISNIFGGTVFIFICHHSISGIIYPIRPQSKVKPMMILSFSIGGGILFLEALLAVLAFGGYDDDKEDFPQSIKEMYTDNFLAIPVVSQIVSFYPLLNMSAVPILTITLRNNIFQLLGIESGPDMTKLKKATWSACL